MPQAVSGHSIRHYPRALPKSARDKIEATIEALMATQTALIAFLDETDSDPDLEPSLAGPYSPVSDEDTRTFDLEQDVADDRHDPDDEGGDEERAQGVR